ncbi:maker188, partial [Drosophila busckii]
ETTTLPALDLDLEQAATTIIVPAVASVTNESTTAAAVAAAAAAAAAASAVDAGVVTEVTDEFVSLGGEGLEQGIRNAVKSEVELAIEAEAEKQVETEQQPKPTGDTAENTAQAAREPKTLEVDTAQVEATKPLPNVTSDLVAVIFDENRAITEQPITKTNLLALEQQHQQINEEEEEAEAATTALPTFELPKHQVTKKQGVEDLLPIEVAAEVPLELDAATEQAVVAVTAEPVQAVKEEPTEPTQQNEIEENIIESQEETQPKVTTIFEKEQEQQQEKQQEQQQPQEEKQQEVVPAETSAVKVAEPAKETVVEEETVAQPAKQTVVEEIVAEPAKETVVEEIVAEPAKETVVEQIVAEPEKEIVEDKIIAEPAKEDIVEAIVPTTESNVEQKLSVKQPELEPSVADPVHPLTQVENEPIVEPESVPAVQSEVNSQSTDQPKEEAATAKPDKADQAKSEESVESVESQEDTAAEHEEAAVHTDKPKAEHDDSAETEELSADDPKARAEDSTATPLVSYPPHNSGQTFDSNLADERSAHLSLASSNRSTLIIALCSGTAVIFIVTSLVIFMLSFQRQRGTLDIEMQEQRLGKDDLDEEDAQMKLLDVELATPVIVSMGSEETDECL